MKEEVGFIYYDNYQFDYLYQNENWIERKWNQFKTWLFYSRVIHL